jgi:microcystin-dependent protein
MSEPFLGEVKIVAFNFAPKNWALCNGQLLPISQNQALFSILGTQYGGDGRVNFGLPDLRGRVPMHAGSSIQGQILGSYTGTVSLANLPGHSHPAYGDPAGANLTAPGAAAVLGNEGAGITPQYYSTNTPTTTMAASMVTNTGGNQPVSLMQPFSVLNFAIALVGIFPSQS